MRHWHILKSTGDMGTPPGPCVVRQWLVKGRQFYEISEVNVQGEYNSVCEYYNSFTTGVCLYYPEQ